MEIKPTRKYILEKFIYYLGWSAISYVIAYLFIVLPFAAGVKPDELFILKSICLGVSVGVFFASIYFQILNIVQISRESIKLNNDTLTSIIGAFTLESTTIPLSQVEYINTNSGILDTFFGTTTISIGSDTMVTSIDGFNKAEADIFAEKVASSQKVKIKTS